MVNYYGCIQGGGAGGWGDVYSWWAVVYKQGEEGAGTGELGTGSEEATGGRGVDVTDRRERSAQCKTIH